MVRAFFVYLLGLAMCMPASALSHLANPRLFMLGGLAMCMPASALSHLANPRLFMLGGLAMCMPAPALAHPGDLRLFMLATNDSARNDSTRLVMPARNNSARHKLPLRNPAPTPVPVEDQIPPFLTRAVEVFGSSLDMVAEYVFSLLESARKNMPSELSGFDKKDEGGHQQKVRGV